MRGFDKLFNLLTLLIMELMLKYLLFDLDGHIPGRLCFLLNCGDHVMDLGVRTKVVLEVLKFSQTSTAPVTDVDSR